jgi:UDP-N-acetylglucosamine 4,6-dehydratase/5-epimerase
MSDEALRKLIQGKTVLITGGTGYLGRSLTREILNYQPHSIRVFSRDEVKHHVVEEMFGEHKALRTLVGDVRDYQRLLKATRNADIVIHAAALKRLDMIEYNVEEAIQTNILGTMNVVNACLYNGVKTAVLVSTDKACSPVNTYGASKFVAERIFSESNYSKGDLPTVFTTVRYGNVLESTGSVIPFFSKKILADEAIPLTHPEMTRFIITPLQAVHLIFRALEHGIGGEVFVPRLPAFAITDLIEMLMEKHQKRTPIKVVGIRPGEKVHELMINEAELPRTYEFRDLFVINSAISSFHAVQTARYVAEGSPLLPRWTAPTYSSKDAVVRGDELKRVLRDAGLL